jgi:DNA-directed RNA polymerase subunit alpha
MKPQFTIETKNTEANTSRFVFEPLPQGFGHTLGNSLRRVLYTSIKGAAITSVKISGVAHQFSTIEGVREDVVHIILALKKTRVVFLGDEPEKLVLSVKGARMVTAGDFELPAGVSITNPELPIAELVDKSARLEIEAIVESGYGYRPAEDMSSNVVGVIPVDATFTPVVRVNYSVEAARVGRVTNFDKLILEVTTDGTISAENALVSAADTLVEYFAVVVNPQASGSQSSSASQTKISGAGSNITIEELDLPTRIANALQKAGFDTVASLLSVPKAELAKIKNLGSKSVTVIEAALAEKNLQLS